MRKLIVYSLMLVFSISLVGGVYAAEKAPDKPEVKATEEEAKINAEIKKLNGEIKGFEVKVKKYRSSIKSGKISVKKGQAAIAELKGWINDRYREIKKLNKKLEELKRKPPAPPPKKVPLPPLKMPGREPPPPELKLRLKGGLGGGALLLTGELVELTGPLFNIILEGGAGLGSDGYTITTASLSQKLRLGKAPSYLKISITYASLSDPVKNIPGVGGTLKRGGHFGGGFSIGSSYRKILFGEIGYNNLLGITAYVGIGRQI
jgi:hypothetical protein